MDSRVVLGRGDGLHAPAISCALPGPGNPRTHATRHPSAPVGHEASDAAAGRATVQLPRVLPQAVGQPPLPLATVAVAARRPRHHALAALRVVAPLAGIGAAVIHHGAGAVLGVILPITFRSGMEAGRPGAGEMGLALAGLLAQLPAVGAARSGSLPQPPHVPLPAREWAQGGPQP